MLQFIIVAVIVGGITAYFFGVPASLKVGEGLISVWIIAGLAIAILSPFIDLLRFFRFLILKAAGLFRRKSSA